MLECGCAICRDRKPAGQVVGQHPGATLPTFNFSGWPEKCARCGGPLIVVQHLDYVTLDGEQYHTGCAGKERKARGWKGYSG